MDFHLEKLTTSLLKHPYFEKAKKVEELGPGHPEDSVYIHLVQTAEFIKRHRDGNFISNPKAKELFLSSMNKEIAGVRYADIVVVTGLVHDIGKILSYKEEGTIFPINQVKPQSNSSQSIHHGFYGGICYKRSSYRSWY